jgi:hypothetical protein
VSFTGFYTSPYAMLHSAVFFASAATIAPVDALPPHTLFATQAAYGLCALLLAALHFQKWCLYVDYTHALPGGAQSAPVLVGRLLLVALYSCKVRGLAQRGAGRLRLSLVPQPCTAA